MSRESGSRNLLLGKRLPRLFKSQHLEDSEYYINLADKGARFERITSDSERCSNVGKMLPSRIIHYRESMSESKGQSMEQI